MPERRENDSFSEDNHVIEEYYANLGLKVKNTSLEYADEESFPKRAKSQSPCRAAQKVTNSHDFYILHLMYF